MSLKRTIPSRTRKNSKPEDLKGPPLEEVINMDKEKNRVNRKAKEEAQKAAGNKSGDGRAREPAIMLGEVVWKNLLQEKDKLKGTDFMDQLEKELGKDDSGKVRRDIKIALLNRKEQFCKADYL